jgi:hypothetical protein
MFAHSLAPDVPHQLSDSNAKIWKKMDWTCNFPKPIERRIKTSAQLAVAADAFIFTVLLFAITDTLQSPLTMHATFEKAQLAIQRVRKVEAPGAETADLPRTVLEPEDMLIDFDGTSSEDIMLPSGSFKPVSPAGKRTFEAASSKVPLVSLNNSAGKAPAAPVTEEEHSSPDDTVVVRGRRKKRRTR